MRKMTSIGNGRKGRGEREFKDEILKRRKTRTYKSKKIMNVKSIEDCIRVGGSICK